MHWLKVLVLCSLLSFAARAEEGHDGGAGKANEASAAPASGTGKTDDWIEISNRVMNLRTKVSMKRDNLRNLIEEKRTTKDPHRIAEIIKLMVEEHKAIQKDAAEYNQQSSILNFRYPEKAMAAGRRKYERIEIGNLNQIESQVTLEARIKNIVEKTKRQYGNEPTSERLPASSSIVPQKSEKKAASTSDYLKEPVVVEK